MRLAMRRIRDYPHHLTVDLGKTVEAGLPIPAAEFPDGVRDELYATQPVSLPEEHWKAVELEHTAVATVSDVLTAVRLGKAVDVARATDSVDGLMASVFRNQDALLSLGHLRSRDQYTFEHSVGVTVLAIALARGLHMPVQQIREVGLAGLFHDLGKALTPLDILNKPDRLRSDEYEIMKRHAADGERILSNVHGIPAYVVRAVGEHHERIDGTGYPRGIKAKEISIYGQILGVCDVYDAITADRCYHRGEHPTIVLRHLLEQAGGAFDRKLVHSFIRCIGIYPVGTLVRMKSDRLAVILESGREKLHKPRVRAFFDLKTKEYIEPVDIDAADPGCHDEVVSYERPERWGVHPHMFLEM